MALGLFVNMKHKLYYGPYYENGFVKKILSKDDNVVALT